MDAQLCNSIQAHLYRINRAIQATVKHDIHDIRDMSVLQFHALLYVKEGHLALKDLATKLDISPASTSLLVDRLVSSNLLERKPSEEDRRQIVIGLTASAQGKMKEARECLAKASEKMLSALTTEEQQELDRLLTKLDLSFQS